MGTTTDPGQQLLDKIAASHVRLAEIDAEIAALRRELADLRRCDGDRNAKPSEASR